MDQNSTTSDLRPSHWQEPVPQGQQSQQPVPAPRPTQPPQQQPMWQAIPPRPVAQSQGQAPDGLLVQVRDVMLTVPNRAKIGKKVLLDHVTVDFRPGEVTALIGPSGCGKSSLLKAICGIQQADRPTRPDQGIFFNGHPYYREMEQLSHRIAYLPQADSEWMHEELEAVDEVDYTWRLRETGRSETQSQDKAARRGETRAHFRRRGLLEHYKDKIATLSGGQKKLVATIESSAANPELLLLDEPTAPLDPGSSAGFVSDLVDNAHEHSLTTIMVTHDPIALRGLGDTCHVILMRKGGTIAFDGTYGQFGMLLRKYYGGKAKRDLSVDDAIQELFKDFANGLLPKFMSDDDPRSASLRPQPQPLPQSPMPLDEIKPIGRLSQFRILLKREIDMLLGRGASAVTLLLIPLILGGILGWVAGANGGDELYKTYMMTQAMMFSLSACSFFVGVFDSIGVFAQKKRTKIEELHGLRPIPYVLAVSVVMTLLCLVQSLLLFLTFTMAADVPVSYLYDARFDMFLTTFLCSYSAAMLGMLCSALFSNSTYMAPVLVIIQIVFSGMIFSLEGITKQISMFVSCHWAMNALAALCDLNNLPSYINMPQVGKISVTYTNPEFASEKFTLFTSWTMLLGLGLSALVLCLIVMSASRRMLFHPDFLGARAISNAIQTAKQVVSKVVAPAVGIAIAVVVILAFKENADFISLSSMGEMFGDFFSYLGTLFSDLPEFIEQLATEGL